MPKCKNKNCDQTAMPGKNYCLCCEVIVKDELDTLFRLNHIAGSIAKEFIEEVIRNAININGNDFYALTSKAIEKAVHQGYKVNGVKWIIDQEEVK